MDKPLSADLFPSGFPSELVSAAFVASNEAAWRPALAARSVEWLGTHGYAVLGTELWLPKDGSIQSLPYFQNVDRQGNEAWDSFVARGGNLGISQGVYPQVHRGRRCLRQRDLGERSGIWKPEGLSRHCYGIISLIGSEDTMIEDLFDLIGGRSAIEAATELFYDKVLHDDSLRHFFEGVDMAHLRSRQAMFISMLLGGRVYTGKSIHDAHARSRDHGLNDAHFDLFLKHFRVALEEVGVKPENAEKIMKRLESKRGTVLNQEIAL